MALTENERRILARMIEAGEEIPSVWRAKLFPEAPHSVEIGKEYRLEYAGKAKREQILAETPAAPWQLVRSFNSNRNKAKYRDGLAHFENLNAALKKAKEGWRYHFKFLSPKDYIGFFGAVKAGMIANWKSSLMQELSE